MPATREATADVIAVPSPASRNVGPHNRITTPANEPADQQPRNCGCHADPTRPACAGPYWQWTCKIAARTICRWLSDDQHHDCRAWLDNDRRLHELPAHLEALGAAALEADPAGSDAAATPAPPANPEPM